MRWSKIVGDFIAAHSAPVALREGILYVRVLQPALHYELEQISKSEILRKLKQRFGGKTIRLSFRPTECFPIIWQSQWLDFMGDGAVFAIKALNLCSPHSGSRSKALARFLSSGGICAA